MKTIRLQLALCGLLYLLPAAGLAAPLDTAGPASTDRLKDGVVQIKAGGRTGTGFILDVKPDKVHVLTACHVTEGQNAPEVSFLRDPNRFLPATVVRNQAELGDQKCLSLLRVAVADPTGLLPLTLSQEAEPSLQTPVFAMGFFRAGQIPWSVTEGRVIGQAEGSLLFTGAIEEGNSGGPLIQDGEVIGVITSKTLDHHMATPARLAQYFVEGILGVLPVRCNAPLIPKTSCLRQIPVDRVTCDHIKKANSFFTEDDYPGTIAQYDKAISSDPRQPVLFNNRGVARLIQRDYEAAEKDFREALRLDPDYSIAELNLAFKNIFRFFFGWAESRKKETTPPNPLLDALSQLTQGAEDTGSNQVTDRLISVAEVFAGTYSDQMKFEKLQKDFREGDIVCYGGDILADNIESNSKQAEELRKAISNLSHLWDGLK